MLLTVEKLCHQNTKTQIRFMKNFVCEVHKGGSLYDP